MRYSLCPERYKRRPTTTSPGFNVNACFSAAVRFFFKNDGPLESPSSACVSCRARLSAPSARPPPFSPPCSGSPVLNDFAVAPKALSGTPTGPWVMPSLGDAPSTNSAASASSGSTKVSVTSANPSGGRFAVPLKIQSDMRSARRDLWLCSPKTHEIASTILDLPQPLGPMMHVSPAPLNVICVFSQNDLKPTRSTLRSFSKISPLWSQPCTRRAFLFPKLANTKHFAHKSEETYSVYSGGFE